MPTQWREKTRVVILIALPFFSSSKLSVPGKIPPYLD
jgi:hypothetical protein